MKRVEPTRNTGGTSGSAELTGTQVDVREELFVVSGLLSWVLARVGRLPRHDRFIRGKMALAGRRRGGHAREYRSR